VSCDIDGKGDLPDPVGFADLAARPDTVATMIQDRLRTGRTPLDAQVFRWPKNRKGFRPMAVVDPLDRVAYRAMIARHVEAIAATADRSVVLSSRLAKPAPAWRVEPYAGAIGERRKLALALFEAHGVLATLDILEYFPSVTRSALEAVFGNLDLDAASFQALLDWLDSLHATSAVPGLPIGLGGSEILGNGLLVPGDRTLTGLGMPFLRYMDDTWLFLASEDAFGPSLAAYAATVSSVELGLTCHPDKCQALDPVTAIQTIQRSGIEYAQMQFADPEVDTEEAALMLFYEAMWDPDAHAPEIRMALGRLRPKSSRMAFEALVKDPTLIALAPRHWRTFVKALLNDRRTSKDLCVPDWVLEQVTGPVSRDDAYVAAVLLQAAGRSKFKPSKDDGVRLFDAARRAETVSHPVQGGAVHLWGRSDAFKPNVAVEATEAAATFAAKRSYAVTLVGRRGHKNMPTWADGLRASHTDLDATADWLLAG